jgi:hypothetical protein
MPFSSDFWREGQEMQDPLLLGKLKYQGRLNAVIPGDLLYVIDSISKRCYLVGGACFSVYHFSLQQPNCPSHFWVHCCQYPVLGLQETYPGFVWCFLLAAVKILIIDMGFLKHF